ncbi:hypothetical protein PspLS_08640 [Pyricularia sp. CBS 133598]|nr:hypothetical protein PspLS_08640 [Pyricularia sp. CBS 133598]
MLFQTSTILALLPALAAAIRAPNKDGLKLVFEETFSGPAGASVNEDTWQIALNINSNNEHQVYTTSNDNMQISGGGSFQIVPRRHADGSWTSGRIESRDAWTAPPGGVMEVEGSIRLGWNLQGSKQGIWPAFWMLGDALRHGTGWPQCGEIDIMEQVSGAPTAYATVHCDVYPGGRCQEPLGRQGTTSMSDDGWHTWNVKIDRSDDDWTRQSITWTKDGAEFHRLTGDMIGDQGTWGTLAHSPMYVLLNVAVGGNWPGAPNDATLDGYGSMMEIQYIAVYTS